MNDEWFRSLLSGADQSGRKHISGSSFLPIAVFLTVAVIMAQAMIKTLVGVHIVAVTILVLLSLDYFVFAWVCN